VSQDCSWNESFALRKTLACRWRSVRHNLRLTKRGSSGASPVGDVGKWTGGGPTIKMKWTAGPDQGFNFHGTSYVAASKEYLGFVGTKLSHTDAKLIKGLVSGC
jgi:hypothetical protein